MLVGLGLTFYAGLSGLLPSELTFPSGIKGGALWQSLQGQAAGDQLPDLPTEGPDAVTSLKLDIGLAKVTIREGERFALIYEGKERHLQVEQEEGLLSIGLKGGWQLADWREPGKYRENLRLTLVVPADYCFQTVAICQDSGILNIQGLEAQGSVTIAMGAGYLSMDDLVTAGADLSLDTGWVKLDNYSGRQGNVSCGWGSVTLACADSSAALQGQVQVDLGDVTIDGRRQSGFVDAGFGYPRAERELDIQCNVGAVNICTAY